MNALEVGRDAPNGRAEPRPNHARRSISTIPELKRQSSRGDLAAVSLLDALDRDERPSFAVRSQPAANADATAPLNLLYCNAALESAEALLARVIGQGDTESIFVEHHGPQHAFRKWLCGEVEQHDVSRRTDCYMFDGLLWTAVTVGDYKIVSGLYASSMWPDTLPTAPHESLLTAPKAMPVQEQAPTLSPVPAPKDTVRSAAAASSPAGTTNDAFDVTFPDAPAALLTDYVRFFRSIDWALTSLGPMGLWPPELRNVVNMCLSNIHPCVLFWGDEAIMIYNEAYIQIIGVLHPAAMGNSAPQVATEYWHGFQPLVDHVTATGRAVSKADCPVFVTRRGFLEETFWSFQCIPVLDCHGHVAGYYHPIIETTEYAFKNLSVISYHADSIRHKLLERRVSSLVELGSQTAKARTLRSYCERTLHTLTLNSKDFPFALLYAAEHAHSSDVSSVSSVITSFAERYTLEGSIGVEPGHPIAPASTDISKEPAGHVLLPFLLQAAKSREAAIVTMGELGLSESDMDNISWKGFGDRCRTVVVCPLMPTSEQVEGFLILGINPRRPFDEDYQQFLHVMVRLLATSLASVVLFDEEVRQKEQAIGQAAIIQEKLLVELQVKEKRFQRFAARADIAIFILDPAGNFTYRNARWYDMFEVAATETDVVGVWANIVFPRDMPKVERLFAQLVVEKLPITVELETRILWVPPPVISQPEGEVSEHYTWILCSAYPEIDANGELVEVVGNVTDISRQKWAEGVQRIRTETALESKQHLEHFIDTTSHEMRNPLSAIMQCADGILDSYSAQISSSPLPGAWSSFLEQTLDAAQTISQCAMHMRHIIDDVLTISKLDSGLMIITPADAQPESILKHAVKMFDAEAKAAGVELSHVLDTSYRNMEIDYCSLDSTRVLQVLINLLTNAIKFTRLEKTRRVCVVLSASTVAPVSIPGGVHFNEEKLVEEDQALVEDWKLDANLVFVQFSVTDTGRGLTEDEHMTLFTRFNQASPRTHISYGGSGLGLFISRRLTELQGGAIGVTSQYKKGSTFSFYIKTRQIKPAMRRRGSMPNALPEDIRHRPTATLGNRGRPSTLFHVSSDNLPIARRSTPPSPRCLRQPLSPHVPTIASANSVYEFMRPSPLDTSHAPPTLHVLVVEDNLVNQRVLAKQLRNMGCIVSVANHGREALAFLERTTFWNREVPASYPTSRRSSSHIPCTEPPPESDPEIPLELSLVLMDWEMPVMNGLEAVMQIRQMEREGVLKDRVPIIGVTANVREQQVRAAMEAGMDDVVGKPFRVAELVVRMRGLICKKGGGK